MGPALKDTAELMLLNVFGRSLSAMCNGSRRLHPLWGGWRSSTWRPVMFIMSNSVTDWWNRRRLTEFHSSRPSDLYQDVDTAVFMSISCTRRILHRLNFHPYSVGRPNVRHADSKRNPCCTPFFGKDSYSLINSWPYQILIFLRRADPVYSRIHFTIANICSQVGQWWSVGSATLIYCSFSHLNSGLHGSFTKVSVWIVPRGPRFR